jgi:Fe-S cluster biogenesis protein NfuA
VSFQVDNGEFQKRAEKVEQLVDRVNTLDDPTARETALELMQSVMDLHGASLTRMVEILNSTEAGRAALSQLHRDPLICGLLVLYGVHPLTLEERVKNAIERVGPQLRKQNATAELLGITDSVVRVKMERSGNGCGSSPDGLKQVVEQGIREVAPEVIEVIAEDATASSSGFVPLTRLQPVTKKETEYEESTA